MPDGKSAPSRVALAVMRDLGLDPANGHGKDANPDDPRNLS